MIIAVDGPTASGKGTIARALARHYGLPHLDTGLLYRAVGWQVKLNGGDPDSEDDAVTATQFHDSLLDSPELRSEAVGGLASRVSVHPGVRKALFDRQRTFATQPGGAVLDGRDIGTVIAPEAEVKLFITASTPARAERRFRELRDAGREVELEEILASLERRDERDRNRKDAPLTVAEDAFVIDTTEFDKDESIAVAIGAVQEAIGSQPCP